MTLTITSLLGCHRATEIQMPKMCFMLSSPSGFLCFLDRKLNPLPVLLIYTNGTIPPRVWGSSDEESSLISPFTHVMTVSAPAPIVCSS